MAKTKLFRVLTQAMRKAHHIDSTDSTHTELGRRTFIKQFSGSMLALSAPGLLSTKLFSQDRPVIIVGAGFAGLSAAYYLQKAGVPCEIYEASMRGGGRVFTGERFNDDGQFCELGAELIDSDHTDLIELATELGVELEDFSSADKGFDDNFFFIGGQKRFTAELVTAVAPLVHRVARDARRSFPFGRLNPHVHHAAVLDRMSLGQYLDMHSSEMEPWLKTAIQIAYEGEYGLEIERQSALNLITLFDRDLSNGFMLFGESDESSRIKGGNENLAKSLLASLKVPIHYGHRLVRVQEQGLGLALAFDSPGGTVELASSRVVVTIPSSVLRGVEGIGALELEKKYLDSIMELGYGLNSKHMTSWKSRFWRQKALGRPALTGTAFTDQGSQTFWETSRLQAGERGILTNYMGGEQSLKSTPNGRIEGMLADLEQMYGPVVREQYEGKHVMMNWAVSPFAKGSYACPMPGQFLTHFQNTGGTHLRGKLYFAGEHCSRLSPGYMNGAVETGKLAVRSILKHS